MEVQLNTPFAISPTINDLTPYYVFKNPHALVFTRFECKRVDFDMEITLPIYHILKFTPTLEIVQNYPLHLLSEHLTFSANNPVNLYFRNISDQIIHVPRRSNLALGYIQKIVHLPHTVFPYAVINIIFLY